MSYLWMGKMIYSRKSRAIERLIYQAFNLALLFLLFPYCLDLVPTQTCFVLLSLLFGIKMPKVIKIAIFFFTRFTLSTVYRNTCKVKFFRVVEWLTLRNIFASVFIPILEHLFWHFFSIVMQFCFQR